MTVKLEQIKNQVENGKQKAAGLKAEIKNLSDQLSSKVAEQATAILEERPTAKLEEAVITLQAKLAGTRLAFEKQMQILNGFQEDEAQELQSIGRAQAESAKAEIDQLISGIYSLIAKSVPLIVDLKAKNVEYLQGLKAAKPAERNFSSTSSQFINSLAVDIQKLLLKFPAEMSTKDLPRLDDLRKALKQ